MCLKNSGCLRDSENFPARHDHRGGLASCANRERHAGLSSHVSQLARRPLHSHDASPPEVSQHVGMVNI